MKGREIRIPELPAIGDEIDLAHVVFPIALVTGPTGIEWVGKVSLSRLAEAINKAKLDAKIEGDRIVFVPEQ